MWASVAAAPRLWSTGLVAPQHMGSSQSKDRTHLPCTGRPTLNQWSAREVLPGIFVKKSSRRKLKLTVLCAPGPGHTAFCRGARLRTWPWCSWPEPGCCCPDTWAAGGIPSPGPPTSSTCVCFPLGIDFPLWGPKKWAEINLGAPIFKMSRSVFSQRRELWGVFQQRPLFRQLTSVRGEGLEASEWTRAGAGGPRSRPCLSGQKRQGTPS